MKERNTYKKNLTKFEKFIKLEKPKCTECDEDGCTCKDKKEVKKDGSK